MPKINIDNNFALYYEAFGKGEPVIFVTGFNADHLIWLDTVKNFADKYQAIAVDNRGCGQSDCPDVPYTIEMMADDIVALCKKLQLQRCRFIGLSMGGAIVQTIAFKYPEFVLSAVLCNTFSKIDIRFALWAQARLDFFTKISPRAMTQASAVWGFSSEFLNRPGMVDAIIEQASANPYPTTEVGYRNQLNALLTFDSEPWLKQIKVPCLVIGSDQDMIVSELHMRQLAESIPHASYHHFNGVGHVPNVEQPEIFNKVVREYLAQH
jgi:3-oxoadipate enol-lactonase